MQSNTATPWIWLEPEPQHTVEDCLQRHRSLVATGIEKVHKLPAIEDMTRQVLNCPGYLTG